MVINKIKVQKAYLQLFLLLFFVACKSHWIPKNNSIENVKIQQQDSFNQSKAELFLQPFRKKLNDSFATIIAFAKEPFYKSRPGTSLGNLVSDALYNYAKKTLYLDADPIIVLQNYGGIRISNLAQGAINLATIFEMLPFENTLVYTKISGKQIATIIRRTNTDGGWPIYFEKDKISSLAQLEKIEHINLITNDYLSLGGDQCQELKNFSFTNSNILLRSIVLEYLKQKKEVYPNNEKRTLE